MKERGNMANLSVDLSKQEYPVFNINENHLLDLKPINFIFGRNGTGKSTLANLISQQYSENSDYSVYIFTGMEGLLVDNRLNGIILGHENRDAKIKIDEIDAELKLKGESLDILDENYKALLWKPEYGEQGIKKSKEFSEKESAKEAYNNKNIYLDNFYIYSARQVREYDDKIKLTLLPSYNKNSFKDEIPDAQKVSDKEFEKLKLQLGDSAKEKISSYNKTRHNYNKLLNEVNDVVQKELKQCVNLDEMDDNAQKKSFALLGKEIHKPGEICAFCGNIYTEQRSKILDSYFSVNDLKHIEENIDSLLEHINNYINETKEVSELKITSFYSFLEDEILESNSKLKESKKEINLFLDNLKQELNKKRKDIFSKCRILDVTVPDSIDLVIDEVNQLIDRHNEYSDNFKKQQDSARNRLRYHVISEILEDVKKYPYEKEWKGYVFEIKNLEQLKQDYENKDKTIKEEAERLNGKEGVEDSDTIEGIKAIINRLEKERKEQLRLTQNTEYLANTINQKLLAGGNKNLKLKVCKVENNVECYMIHDEKNGIRDITRVSTGEKNIIAFLYFIGRLQSINQKQKKIIVFDDPMTSNDDATQYLMITELQKVYRDNNKVFNKDNDFFVCMTHNVHFYLNVQPQGVFKDKKGRTKYDLNNFYIIRNRDFFKVKNENEDFKTSYEALWMELNDLYKNDYLNSVLNTMRRIVETFIKFNKIHQDKFYKNKNEHLKLFNVGSHAAIDELSADSIGKTKEELSQMFRDLFVDNGFKDHFDSYWRN